MKSLYFLAVWIILSLVVSSMVAPGPLLAGGKSEDNIDGKTNGLKQRIDFGNAHIMGQSIKSGAVYLMHRKRSNIDSMLKVRRDYRSEIKEEYGLENTALDTVEKQTAQTLKKRIGP